MSDHVDEVSTPEALAALLAGDSREAVFLSASVPSTDVDPSPRPARIRDAVTAIASLCLHSDRRLVFGAHPSISPMILAVAHSWRAPPNTVLVFQSRFFESKFPQATYDLADWSSGRMFLTPEVPGADEMATRKASLELMRELMIRVSPMVAGVFIGGMPGVRDESDLLGRMHPGVPRFALATTGGMAAVLHQQPEYWMHDASLRDLLGNDDEAYLVVAQEIFAGI